MNLNVTFDPSVSSAPAGFVAAVNYVVGLFDATFTNPVMINIDVGWGEIDGQTISSDELGESLQNSTNGYSYGQIQSALASLAAKGDSAVAGALSSIDPTGGGTFDPGTADARALGLMPAQSNEIDGWIGLTSTPNTFTFSSTDPAVSGEYDAIGVIEHEITEVMGRVAGLNPSYYSVLDLYRYSSSGILDLTGSNHDYFSINSGVTNLDSFNHDPNGDLGDWAASAGNDSFLAYANPGVPGTLTQTDLVVMEALGWTENLVPTVSAAFEAPLPANLTTGAVATFALDLSTYVTVTGSPTLTLSNGGTATYVGGSGGHALEFSYTLSSGVSSGETLTPTAVNLNGGSIDSAAGVAADLTMQGLPVSQYADVIISNSPGSVLTGPGNDVFLISGGNDTVNGGTGVNTVVFTGAIEQYLVATSGSEITVTDGIAGRDGVDTLTNIQQVEFSDVTLVFDLHSSQDFLVYELYQAAFARIPDLAGFRYWAGVADSTNTSALTLADAFLAAPEFAAKYGSHLTNGQFVTELYSNVLGRAPDQAGLNYWVGQANAGQAHDQLLVDFATSAEDVNLIGAHTANGYWTT